MAAQPTTDFLDAIADKIRYGPAAVAFAGTTTAASATVASIVSTDGIEVGMTVYGAVLDAPAPTVLSKTSTTLTLSGPASSTHANIPMVAVNNSQDRVVTLGLFTGSPTLDPTTTLAALQALAPVYPGYAEQDVAFGAERGDANLDVILPVSPTTWQPTSDPVATQTVTGCYLAIDGELWLAEGFAAPWDVVSALSALDLLLEVYSPNLQVYGMVCSTCRT